MYNQKNTTSLNSTSQKSLNHIIYMFQEQNTQIPNQATVNRNEQMIEDNDAENKFEDYIDKEIKAIQNKDGKISFKIKYNSTGFGFTIHSTDQIPIASQTIFNQTIKKVSIPTPSILHKNQSLLQENSSMPIVIANPNSIIGVYINEEEDEEDNAYKHTGDLLEDTVNIICNFFDIVDNMPQSMHNEAANSCQLI